MDIYKSEKLLQKEMDSFKPFGIPICCITILSVELHKQNRLHRCFILWTFQNNILMHMGLCLIWHIINTQETENKA